MDGYDRAVMTREETSGLLGTDESEEKDQTVPTFAGVLGSSDQRTRLRGYDIFEESVKDGLFCSCFDYRLLAGSFTFFRRSFIRCIIKNWAEADKTMGARNNKSRRL